MCSLFGPVYKATTQKKNVTNVVEKLCIYTETLKDLKHCSIKARPVVDDITVRAVYMIIGLEAVVEVS